MADITTDEATPNDPGRQPVQARLPITNILQMGGTIFSNGRHHLHQISLQDTKAASLSSTDRPRGKEQ